MKTAEKYHIRVIGPNCIGVIDNRSRVDTTFVDTGVPFSTFGAPTGITFISQSGIIHQFEFDLSMFLHRERETGGGTCSACALQ